MERVYDKISIDNIDMVSDEDARRLGQYFELYSPYIRALMTKDMDTAKKFGHPEIASRSIKSFENINMKNPYEFNKVRNMFTKNFYYPEDAVNPDHPVHFIYTFNNFLRSKEISGINDLIHFYDRCCEFLGAFKRYKKDDVNNIELMIKTRVILFEIFPYVFDATEVLYEVFASEQVNNIVNSTFRYRAILDSMVTGAAGKINEKYVMEFAYILACFYDKHGLSHETFFNGSKSEDPFLLLYMDKIRNQNIDLMTTLSAYMNYYKSGVIRETTLETLDRVYESKRKHIFVESTDIIGESDGDVIIFGDKGIAESITRNGLEPFKRDVLRFNHDMVKNFLPNVVEPCKIDFNINDQFKMYLQSELECKLLNVMIKNNHEASTYTILSYDGDNFVLFTATDRPDSLLGLTINESSDTKERKLISIDRDEDVTFQFRINDELV